MRTLICVSVFEMYLSFVMGGKKVISGFVLSDCLSCTFFSLFCFSSHVSPLLTALFPRTLTTYEFGTFKFSPSKANGTYSRTNSTMSTGYNKAVIVSSCSSLICCCRDNQQKPFPCCSVLMFQVFECFLLSRHFQFICFQYKMKKPSCSNLWQWIVYRHVIPTFIFVQKFLLGGHAD